MKKNTKDSSKKEKEAATIEHPEKKEGKKQSKKEAKEDSEKEEESPIEKLEADLAESKDKYLRLYSEFDNFRRRTAREKLDLMQTAGERLVVAFLPVIDDFNRAEDSLSSNDAKAIAEGVKLISDKFAKTLEAEGLKLMETKEGTAFDPEFHEAVTQIPTPSKKLKGKIVDTIERGYFLGEKVIRHAKVVIGA
jgi:molecular chaperone GrpE